jgi:hypothetical protein
MRDDDDFFDDDIGWDDEAETRSSESYPRGSQTEERRTLAGDIERLRRERPRWLAWAAGLSALIVVVVIVVVALGSGSPRKRAPTVESTAIATTPPPPATTAAPPPAPAIRVPTTIALKRGDSGTPVRTLQRALVRLGLLKATPNGVYGPQTQAAVTAFQTAHGLTADGVFGPKTAAAMNAALRAKG